MLVYPRHSLLRRGAKPLKIDGNIVEDKHLGKFRRTGVRRFPKKGEYYWCEKSIGIGISMGKDSVPREILEPIKEDPKNVVPSK